MGLDGKVESSVYSLSIVFDAAKKNAVPRGNQKAVRDDVGGVRTLFYAVDIVGHDKQ